MRLPSIRPTLKDAGVVYERMDACKLCYSLSLGQHSSSCPETEAFGNLILGHGELDMFQCIRFQIKLRVDVTIRQSIQLK
ncbi:unnamed protein product [Rodentolepis nana]|uniref:Zf-CCHC_4 domain-containing protein n=1 Tax=Rodentolepis nana TaxID=102285 RepID=A0A0R3TZ19_RODNA|nr:unnamed protein product [Rodentolepis nana]